MKRIGLKRLNKEKYMLKAVLTIEMTYLFGIFLMIFVLIVHTVFYYHDKNILLGAACETAVLFAQIERRPDEYSDDSAETFYQKRIEGKLILFSGASTRIEQNDEKIDVVVSAQNGFMKINVHGEAEVVKPEEKIRKKRRIENMIEKE